MTATLIRTEVPRPHRPLLVMTAALTILAVVAGLGVFVDDRVLTGAAVWLKPFKFAVSFAAYGLTLAWMLSVLPRRSRAGEWAATAIVAFSLIEVAIITVQAARGHRSHFNTTNPFDSVLWSVMGMSIMVLFAAHLVFGLAALLQRIPDRLAAYGIRLGLGLAAIGMLAAIPMVMPQRNPGVDGITGAHAVGVLDGGPGMPLTGWSTTGGDLRIGHFVGLHGLQALPLLAWLLKRRGVDERTGTRLLLVAGAAYGLLSLLLTWQALRGQPLLRPDALTLGALAALVAGTALAVTTVTRRALS